MKLSLILATVNRTRELARFLDSLDTQTWRNFELIVVDQNPDDRLVPILASYRDRFTIRHLHSVAGVSRARNIGLRNACGELIGFPDDDCWYLPNLLERTYAFLDTHPDIDGLTGPCIDEIGTILRRGPNSPGYLTRYNLFSRVHAFTLFLRRDRIGELGGFDETLGPGAGTPWGSAEDHEYVARALEANLRLFYDPGVGVCHPDAPHSFSETEIRKERAYSRGQGRFLRMHDYSRSYFAYRVVRALGGAAVGAIRADRAKVRYHLNGALGKLEGWRARAAQVAATSQTPFISIATREARD
jgi:glycosyltransferase involved in cell wall biosynthesis